MKVKEEKEREGEEVGEKGEVVAVVKEEERSEEEEGGQRERGTRSLDGERS